MKVGRLRSLSREAAFFLAFPELLYFLRIGVWFIPGIPRGKRLS